jgi:hypothetical protein
MRRDGGPRQTKPPPPKWLGLQKLQLPCRLRPPRCPFPRQVPGVAAAEGPKISRWRQTVHREYQQTSPANRKRGKQNLLKLEAP